MRLLLLHAFRFNHAAVRVPYLVLVGIKRWGIQTARQRHRTCLLSATTYVPAPAPHGRVGTNSARTTRSL